MLQNLPIAFDLLFLGGFVGALVAAAMARNFRLAFLVLAGMMVAAAVAPALNIKGDAFAQTWAVAFTQRRREWYMIFGLMAAVFLLTNQHRLGRGLAPPQMVCLLILGVYGGLMRIVGTSDPISGLVAVAFMVVSLVPLLYLIPALLQDENDIFALFRWMMVALGVWAAACTVQFVINQDLLYSGSTKRFQGLSGNPQHAAVYLAFSAVAALFLFFNDPKHRYRPLWAVMSALAFVLILWTGSRTGVGMFVIGGGIVALTRLGRTVLLLPIAGLIGFAIMSVLDAFGVQFDIAGLTSRGDNRTAAWGRLFQQILEHPLFGVGGTEETLASENSYLYAMASYGLGAGLALLALLLVTIRLASRLVALRRRVAPRHKAIIDLVLAGNLMYFSGALFEGYMIARIAAPLSFILVFAAVGHRLPRIIAQQQADALGRAAAPGDEPTDTHADHADAHTGYSAEPDYSEYGDFRGYGEDTHDHAHEDHDHAAHR
ncbi:MAG: O-antigen ligase family protein [Phycisphaerales bacterium]|nr:O-antigen ligase family protein [Phycisphaerales bacterium]